LRDVLPYSGERKNVFLKRSDRGGIIFLEASFGVLGDALIKNPTILLGIVLLSIGSIGLLIGRPVLVIFGTNGFHNLMHISSGLLALFAAINGYRAAKLYLNLFGFFYAAVALGGFLQYEPVVLFLNLNTADNILHTVIAATCFYISKTSTRD